jgi:hypothetical protein
MAGAQETLAAGHVMVVALDPPPGVQQEGEGRVWTRQAEPDPVSVEGVECGDQGRNRITVLRRGQVDQPARPGRAGGEHEHELNRDCPGHGPRLR